MKVCYHPARPLSNFHTSQRHSVPTVTLVVSTASMQLKAGHTTRGAQGTLATIITRRSTVYMYVNLGREKSMSLEDLLA